MSETATSRYSMSTYNRLASVLASVSYKDWYFRIGYDGRYHIMLQFKAPCTTTGEMEVQNSRKWYFSEHMTDSEIVQTAFLAVKTAEEHEMRENFLLNGVQVFGPHFDLFHLAAQISAKNVKEEHREDVRTTA